jgi:hypothetical protein
MTDTRKTTLLDLDSDPILRMLADGGAWDVAVEMEYEMHLIPKLSGQLKASLRKKSPSALKHRERLINDLQSAYSYCGTSEERFQVILADLLTP